MIQLLQAGVPVYLPNSNARQQNHGDRVQFTLILGDVDLVSNQDLCAGTLPAPCAGSTEHEAARGIDIETGDDACTRGAGDNEEGYGRVLKGAGFSEVVETENIVGGTAYY